MSGLAGAGGVMGTKQWVWTHIFHSPVQRANRKGPLAAGARAGCRSEHENEEGGRD